MVPEHLLTVEGAQTIRSEIERLREQKEREMAARLRDARAYGDGGGNDDYLAIKEEEAVLAARIASLEQILRRASVVEDGQLDPGVVAIGSTVTVEDVARLSRVSYRVVGMHERVNGEEVSAGSPIGRALLGRRAGDIVSVALPKGRRREFRVVATEPFAAGSVPGL